MTEFLVAFWTNVFFIFGIAGVGVIAWSLIARVGPTERGESFWHPMLPWKILAGFLLIAIANLPTADDLWKVRVSLIKYHLASPENVQKGVETIERIGKKLECKYLGGCEEPKADPKP